LNLAQVPGAIEQLAGVFNGPDPPRYVARYGKADSMPGGEAITEAFKRRYRWERTVAGVPLYRLIEGTEPHPVTSKVTSPETVAEPGSGH
jgi:hypothetical protein